MRSIVRSHPVFPSKELACFDRDDNCARVTDTFKLRAYRELDQEPSIALWLETWKLAYPSIDFDARVEWWRARWRDELEPNATVIVADSDGKMAGFVTIDSSGYLDQLIVGPAHQGSPIATALVDEAKRRSPTGVTLKVNADNFRAIRFYERNGFVHVGEDINAGSGRKILKMNWTRQLCSPDERSDTTPGASETA